jgi:uncharacterized protein
MITWDPEKRSKNLSNHGIDFAELATVFDYPMLTVEDSRLAYGEQRLQSLCWFQGRVVVLIWTECNGAARLISCRNGTKHETRQYFKTTAF